MAVVQGSWRPPAVLRNNLNTVSDRIFETIIFFNFSAQDSSILKISVPISKRRSWGFQNTPNMWRLDDFGPSYCNLKKIKISKNNFDWRLEKESQNIAFLKCHNLAQNNLDFARWECFGILRTSSCWWALRFLKLMHPGLRNWRKREGLKDSVANCTRTFFLGF